MNDLKAIEFGEFNIFERKNKAVSGIIHSFHVFPLFH